MNVGRPRTTRREVEIGEHRRDRYLLRLPRRPFASFENIQQVEVLVEAVQRRALLAVLGRAAGARGLVTVLNQRAVTHTQAYLGAALVAIDLVGRLAGDEPTRTAVAEVPGLVAEQLEKAVTWADHLSEGLQVPVSALVFGTRHAWPAAMEAALLLKETSIVPAEGMETREGATSGMYALSMSHLVLGLGLGPSDQLVSEALKVCAATGARTLRVDTPSGASPLVSVATSFLHPLALAIRLALIQGRDPDQPGWYAAYQETAWSSAPAAAEPE